MIIHPIPPVYDESSKVLILGSFPSVKSREACFFYGHPQNRFWKLIASIFEDDVPETIDEKKAFLFRHVFIESNDQTGYIKPQNYELSKARKFKNDISKRENMDHDPETDSYTCKNGKKQSSTRKPALAFTLVVLLLVGLGFSGYNFLNQDTHSDVPENVIEFGEKYPEAREYVQNFTEYVDKDLDMDVSKEMAASDIPLFIQWDKRWGYRNYGANYVGVAGCGPTCLAMVACGLKNDSELNPFVVATYASNEGFYTYGEGTSWSIMTEGAKHYGLNVVSGDVSSDYILANLSSKAPMICSMAPGDFTKTGHFIVLTGIDADGKIIVNDPNSPKNSSKHWDVDSLVSQMKSVWKYSNA